MPWRVIAFGFLLTLSSALGQTHFISLFNAQLRETFVLTHSEIGVLYSTATLCSAAILPWAGKRIDSTDLRYYTAAVIAGLGGAALLVTLSVESASAIDNNISAYAVWILFAAFFLLRLFGQGLSSHIGFTATARLATVARGKSISLAGLGMSMGEAIAPPLVASLLLIFAWPQVWLFAACVQLTLVFAAAQWLLYKLPCTPPNKTQTQEHDTQSWTRRQVLHDTRFWRAAPALFAPACVVTALFFHQYSLAEYQNASFAVWTAGVVAYSAGAVAASLFSGWLTDKIGGRRVVKWVTVPLLLSVLLPAILSFGGISFPYYALMGMSAGMSVPSTNALWIELYGRAHLGAVRALSQAMVVLFSAIGPVLYGVLLDSRMAWDNILFLTAAWLAAAAVLLAITPLHPLPPPQHN